MQRLSTMHNIFSAVILSFPSGESWSPKELPAFVISGQNPLCISQPHQQNIMLHQSLCNYLDRLFPSCTKEEIIGQSPDGSWKEDCWAIYGLTMEEAKSIARLFVQLAIFHFDDNGRNVIDCRKGK
jgi:hypothetical protein